MKEQEYLFSAIADVSALMQRALGERGATPIAPDSQRHVQELREYFESGGELPENHLWPDVGSLYKAIFSFKSR